MSGGYISCADFRGEDQTGTPFLEVLEDLVAILTDEERAAWKADLIPKLRSQMDELNEDDAPVLRLSPEMMEQFIPPLARYRDSLLEQLGNPPPETWHEIGDPETGDGWRLLCADDLLLANEACRRTGEPVWVEFE